MVTNGACIVFCIISFVIGCWVSLSLISLCEIAKDRKGEKNKDE